MTCFDLSCRQHIIIDISSKHNSFCVYMNFCKIRLAPDILHLQRICYCGLARPLFYFVIYVSYLRFRCKKPLIHTICSTWTISGGDLERCYPEHCYSGCRRVRAASLVSMDPWSTVFATIPCKWIFKEEWR